MTYWLGKESMAERKDFPVGTMRVWHNDERQCYSVSEPSDPEGGTAWLVWDASEIWDGSSWKKPPADGVARE